ncbi:ribonuclease R [Acholeplasma morum]|jgi:ribonuclease R|uniref:ribonuclease R n=1 Tax=Paracholeplasma morum TaxID=264637 RepID=UPI001958F708|nr:ribonuclease R [Paracholeplasma morum]MBM7453654.1 ribonuclease R [Paracholeplasma morum]
MILLKLFKDSKAYRFDELLEITQMDVISLTEALDQLVSQKRLDYKNDLYQLRPNYRVGFLDVKNQGFAFLLQEKDDLFIYEEDLGLSLDGDLVLVHVGVKNKVVDVLERTVKQIVVHVKKVNQTVMFLPIKPFRLQIEVEEKDFIGGEVLLIEIQSYEGKKAIGQIVQCLGFETDPGMDILELVYEANWPYEFSQETLKEADEIESIDTMPRRVVENELIVTIDGKDAKDLDDAISLKKDGTDYILAVHIADVSAYVRPNSFMEKEAFERTTSVYLADRVIPMLPRRLSNDLCSLNADTLKKCLSVTMRLDAYGNPISHQIEQTWVKVNYRLNYDEVNDFLDNGSSLVNKEVEQTIKDMYQLSYILEEKRVDRGALNFKSLEFKYETDEMGHIIDIHPYVTGKGQALIESFMVLANETVSLHLSSLELPCIYRVHDKPDPDKLIQVMQMVKELGLKIPKVNHITPKTLQNILNKLEGHPLELVFHTLFLRSMQKAEYSGKNIGHYGLASKYYSHFTSPIRRYPDLLLHRLIKAFLIDTTDFDKNYQYYEAYVNVASERCSVMERKADELERETDKLKTTQFMANKVNQSFKAVISSVTKAGLFVRLENGIEGLCPMRMMNDYYYFDEKALTLKGKDTKQLFKIGQEVEVKLKDVDVKLRQLTFIVKEEKKYERKYSRPKQKGKA